MVRGDQEVLPHLERVGPEGLAPIDREHLAVGSVPEVDPLGLDQQGLGTYAGRCGLQVQGASHRGGLHAQAVGQQRVRELLEARVVRPRGLTAEDEIVEEDQVPAVQGGSLPLDPDPRAITRGIEYMAEEINKVAKDEFEIKLGRKQIRLMPVGGSEEDEE